MTTVEPMVRLPLPPVPNVLKVVFRGFVDNLLREVWDNVLHLQWAGSAPSVTDLETLASHFATLWSSNMSAEQPSPTSLTSVECTDLTSATGASAAAAVDVAGGRGDDSIPANAAVLISYPIVRRYQGGHYRTYLVAGGNADLQGATEWSTLFQAEVLTHWHSMLTAMLASSAGGASFTNLVGVSYHNKATGTPPHYYRAVPLVDVLSLGTMYSNLGMASQRRRIGRGGETEKAPAARARRMTIARAASIYTMPTPTP